MLDVATVLRPHGIRGAVRLRCSPEHWEWLSTKPHVTVAGTRTKIVDVAGTADQPIVRFEHCADRNAVEPLRGEQVLAARDDLPPLEVDEYRAADLEGCAVLGLDGQSAGEVVKVDLLPANAVLTVRLEADGRTILVPFVRDVVPEVDLAARSVTVDLEFVGG